MGDDARRRLSLHLQENVLTLPERACEDAEAPATAPCRHRMLLPPCPYQCERGCVVCVGKLNSISLSKLRH